MNLQYEIRLLFFFSSSFSPCLSFQTPSFTIFIIFFLLARPYLLLPRSLPTPPLTHSFRFLLVILNPNSTGLQLQKTSRIIPP